MLHKSPILYRFEVKMYIMYIIKKVVNDIDVFNLFWVVYTIELNE